MCLASPSCCKLVWKLDQTLSSGLVVEKGILTCECEADVVSLDQEGTDEADVFHQRNR